MESGSGSLTGESRPLRAVFGLGNPGPRYEKTRHNAGFLAVEAIRAAHAGRWIRRGDREDAAIDLGGARVLLSRPLTFMNRSGLAMESLLADSGLSPSEVLVVLDDVALPEGRLRLRPSGGAGGHKGLISILASAGTEEVPRLRVGVGAPPPGVEMVDFVLEVMAGPDGQRLDRIAAAAALAASHAVTQGIGPAMNRFNSAWIDGFAPADAAAPPDSGGTGAPDPGR